MLLNFAWRIVRLGTHTPPARNAANIVPIRSSSVVWKPRGKPSGTPFAMYSSSVGDVIGIDLGTTNSCVAMLSGRVPIVLENSEGKRTTPSVVSFDKNTVLVGEMAKRQFVTNVQNTFYATKRLIGRKYNDAKNLKVSYNIVPGPNGDAWVQTTFGKQYSPSQIGAHVLRKMRDTATSYAGKSIYKAVITVPAYFDDSQRQATKDAGRIAGLEVLRIINEPTAAALAYGMNQSQNQTIAVFDLGGGTFDISIIEIAGGVFEVKATNGDTFLGGEDFDHALLNHFVQEFKQKERIDLSRDQLSMYRLREACEKAKKDLDHTEKVDIEIPWITHGKHFKATLTRQTFEQLVQPLVKRAIEPCKSCIRDSGVPMHHINEVILVGGMTRTPVVVSAVRNFFGKEPRKGVNPDEAVAIGAAIQGGVLVGEVKDLILLDVTPLSLGVDLPGDIFCRIINRNTPIPHSATKRFTTLHDLQTSVLFKVYQGERTVASENKYLGEVTLYGLVPAPRGAPKIDCSFTIDANGILSVHATDVVTKSEAKVALQVSGGLSEAQIERMIREAEVQNEKDKKRIEFAKLKNDFEETLYKMQKTVSDLRIGGTMRDQETNRMQREVDAGRQFLEEIQGAHSHNSQQLDEAFSKLSREHERLKGRLMMFGARFYQLGGKK